MRSGNRLLFSSEIIKVQASSNINSKIRCDLLKKEKRVKDAQNQKKKKLISSIFH